MITPTTPVVVPAVDSKTADGIWITSMNINAQSATQPIRAQIMVAPYISSTGEILRTLQKPIMIEDVTAEAGSTAEVGAAMTAIYAAVQALVTKNNIFS